jgi:hypothetical protein
MLQIVDGPTQQLQGIENAAITQGDTVKGQILNTVNSVQGSTNSMKQMVVGQVDNIKSSYQDTAKTYDGYR